MCTGIRLRAQDGAVVAGRTLEFAEPLTSELLIIPRNYAYVGTALAGAGYAWKSRYGVVGANALKLSHIVDGINEVGLAGGLFYFPDYAGYQTVGDTKRVIAPWELMTLILTSCATLSDVRELLAQITVAAVPFPAWGFVPPVHAVVHEPSGQSLVIEYVAGTLLVHDNPLGIMTNAPTFDWHMTNLNNYTGLTRENAPTRSVAGVALKPFGQGSGMRGLPGDFSSPSRFVRAGTFAATVVPAATAMAGVALLFHLLNNFDIPQGAVCSDATAKSCEYTEWTSVADLAQRRYYLRMHDSPLPVMVDLAKADFSKEHVVLQPVVLAESYREMTL